MIQAPETGNAIAPAAVSGFRWHEVIAEYAASVSCSAACYEQVEHVGVFAVVMPERELREVKRQILLGNMVETSDYPTLQQCPKAINVLSVNFAAHILSRAVNNGIVRVAVFQRAITRCLIRRDQFNLVADSLANEAVESTHIGALDDLADDVTFTCNRRDDWRFTSRTTACSQALASVLVLFLPTDKSLIDFDDAHQFLELFIVHRGTDTRAHVPDRLVTGLIVKHGALDLKSTHAFLGVQHQETDREPSFERVLGVLEHGAGNQREPITLLGALMTLPVPSTGELVDLVGIAARAVDLAVRPAMLEQKLFAGFFSREKSIQFAQLDHAEQFSRFGGFLLSVG